MQASNARAASAGSMLGTVAAALGALLSACAPAPHSVVADVAHVSKWPYSLSAGEPNGQTEAAALVDVPPAPDPAFPVPRYDVIAQRVTDRTDDVTSYYVVVDAVDPAAGAHKEAVKQIVRVLASVNGGPDFSAHFWDDLVAAQTEVSHRSHPDLFSQEQYEAKEAGNSRHFIASYVGGLASPGQPPAYVLFWFPSAGSSHPEVGDLMSAEVWQP